jgi:hypothetical protein
MPIMENLANTSGFITMFLKPLGEGFQSGVVVPEMLSIIPVLEGVRP